MREAEAQRGTWILHHHTGKQEQRQISHLLQTRKLPSGECKGHSRDFPGDPGAQNPSSRAGSVGMIPAAGTKPTDSGVSLPQLRPHAVHPPTPKKKQSGEDVAQAAIRC